MTPRTLRKGGSRKPQPADCNGCGKCSSDACPCDLVPFLQVVFPAFDHRRGDNLETDAAGPSSGTCEVHSKQFTGPGAVTGIDERQRVRVGHVGRRPALPDPSDLGEFLERIEDFQTGTLYESCACDGLTREP